MNRDGPDGAINLLLYRFAPLWLAHLVLGALVGLVLAAASPPFYTSTASALVAADADNGSRSVSSANTIITSVMPTVVQLSTSDSVLAEVAQATGLDQSEVKRAVSVSSSTNSLIINVSATASSPERAHAIAEAETSALRNVVSGLSVKSQEETALTLTDIDVASVPTAPSGPSKTRYAMYGGAVGAAAGLAVTLAVLRVRSNGPEGQEAGREGPPTE